MAKPGRPKKQPISVKIKDALGIAQDAIDDLMPAEVQNVLVPTVQSPDTAVESSPSRISKDAQDDYDFARTNLISLLEKGGKILNGITELAEGSDTPRAFEVAGNVLKVLIEGTRELMTLQKDIRDIEKKSGSNGVENTPVQIANAENVNNVILEASTMEVLEMMQRIKKEKQELLDKGEN